MRIDGCSGVIIRRVTMKQRTKFRKQRGKGRESKGRRELRMIDDGKRY